MKKAKLIFIISCLVIVNKVAAQFTNTTNSGYGSPITPGGYFEKVFDKDGREYNLADLVIKEIGVGSQINSVISSTCQGGIFIVHFANGSGISSTTNTFDIACRNTICQVLENISGLLGWTGSWPSTGYVHILVDDITPYASGTPSTSSVLGVASSYYALPINPFSVNPGLLKNQVEKTIQSKQNAWTNVISPLNISGGSFYHGFMAFNFANPTFTWNPQYAVTANASQIDLYTVILHEITHALGFASLINSSGFSLFGASNNYYSTYDNHLFDKNYTKLIVSSGCSFQYGLAFNTNTLNLQPACPCPTCYVTDITTCSVACQYSSANVPTMSIYTPNCFEPGSSLSHFEDMCYPNNNSSNNNLYFTMSNSNGNGVNKRYLKQEERNVLCDLGYTVATTYTSSAMSATTAYSGGLCTSPAIWGINDGIK
jgi:hypothetical protein